MNKSYSDPNKIDCEHGQLKISCLICELKSQLKLENRFRVACETANKILTQKLSKACADKMEAEKKVEEMREVLQVYGSHDYECLLNFKTLECSCGYLKALSSLSSTPSKSYISREVADKLAEALEESQWNQRTNQAKEALEAYREEAGSK